MKKIIGRFRCKVLYICNSEKAFYAALRAARQHWRDGWNVTEFIFGDCERIKQLRFPGM